MCWRLKIKRKNSLDNCSVCTWINIECNQCLLDLFQLHANLEEKAAEVPYCTLLRICNNDSASKRIDLSMLYNVFDHGSELTFRDCFIHNDGDIPLVPNFDSDSDHAITINFALTLHARYWTEEAGWGEICSFLRHNIWVDSMCKYFPNYVSKNILRCRDQSFLWIWAGIVLLTWTNDDQCCHVHFSQMQNEESWRHFTEVTNQINQSLVFFHNHRVYMWSHCELDSMQNLLVWLLCAKWGIPLDNCDLLQLTNLLHAIPSTLNFINWWHTAPRKTS